MLPVLFQISLGFGGFQQMLSNMVNLGFFQFLFPFLLALAIFYGILKYAMGDRLPNSAVGLISLILGFFVMLFAAGNPSIVIFLQTISGSALIISTVILFFIILLGMIGWKIGDVFTGPWKLIVTLVILAIVLSVVFGAGTFLIPGVTVGSDFWTIVFFIIILAIVLWFLGKGGGAGEAKGGGKKE